MNGEKPGAPTPEQYLRLISDIRGLPEHPIGDHLTDEEVLDVVLGYVPDTDSRHLDTHLDSCEECRLELEQQKYF